MEIISRKQAIERGLKRYFTGKPCVHGHVSERLVTVGCMECHRQSHLVKNMSQRSIEADRARDKLRTKRSLITPEQARRDDAKIMRNRLKRKKRVPVWSETEAITQFYVDCPKGYHVDHIIPLCGKLVSGLHVLSNLQYLPAKDNLSKGNAFTPDLF